MNCLKVLTVRPSRAARTTLADVADAQVARGGRRQAFVDLALPHDIGQEVADLTGVVRLGLAELGVKEIWAKAVSGAHGAILEQLGVPHVIYPEQDMGRRVAHLVRGSMQDYIEVDNDFALVRTTPHRAITGIPLGQTDLRAKHGVTIVAVKPLGKPWTHATAETVLRPEDVILVSGRTRTAEAFSQLR